MTENIATSLEADTSFKYNADPKGFVTGFTVMNADFFATSPDVTVLVYILPGYTGLIYGNYSEAMMHLNRSDRLTKFRFQTTEYSDHVAESVQLLNADGTHFSGPITRGEGGVYWEQHTGRFYHYLANPAGMLIEFCDRMSEIEGAYEFDLEAATSASEITEIKTRSGEERASLLAVMAETHQLHPTVIRDICETCVRLLNSTPG